ncbi:UvrD-helicase domain-containing protein [Acidicapsa dinghuensis]|uniref:DNA 3'-5' helicase n=1 Tax=Acidicapsa dinghuensis TaxID=2218256 RepID=A0ABW1EG97_9BACT|nr:UvrD-helicase domain-containing protein [Acidicapsa dinghuensis]
MSNADNFAVSVPPTDPHPPPDASERSHALDPAQSFLVQAPAGSGKTYLLTQRFLRLLAEVESPDQIVAITFTKPAAAEMRNRILDALETAARPFDGTGRDENLTALAARALERSEQLGWQLLRQNAQLRILTIDAFCRSLALQSPLSWGMLSGLGGQLEMAEDPGQLYRLAARRTVEAIAREDSPARPSVEALLRWRDNNWNDVEDLIAEMLQARSRWFQDFVFAHNIDWAALRQRLEQPFRRGALKSLERFITLLDQAPDGRDRILTLARSACETPGDSSPYELAELVDLSSSFTSEDGQEEALILESAVSEFRCIAKFLLNNDGNWRRPGGLNKNHGFPSTTDGKLQKTRFSELTCDLDNVPGLREALAEFAGGLPLRYSDEEWELVRHCFAVLREAAGQLHVVFAESGTVDYTEVAQMALRILAPENGYPSDLAIRQADGVRHLLIDEFQDTSRSQYELLTRLIAAWPEREGRSCFCVGDPMQSIYGFREAEVELFERMKRFGLPAGREAGDDPYEFTFVPLRANFRTTRSLVDDLNDRFAEIFAASEGGVPFSPAEAVRTDGSQARAELHLEFTRAGKAALIPALSNPDTSSAQATAHAQLTQIVELVRLRLAEASVQGLQRFRIAVLGRKRKSLTPIAEALTKAGIPFRSVDVVPLQERSEVVDALSLARALLHPADRTAWLGVLRAPWCGLSLAELYLLTSDDDETINGTPIPELLRARLPLLAANEALSARAIEATTRVAQVCNEATASRAAAGSLSLGTWLESVWLALGGADTVNPEQAENLRVLWAALDGLPEGEMDLCGPALDAALRDLYAQPDPLANSEFGVQLMTIHKSKGLEFEVVIVPDLDAPERAGQREMMAWLERGLAEPGSGEEHTSEFLVAPIQAKGTKAGATKNWVAKAKRELERQEAKRLLYVAATRAREELHLFARPRFQVDKKTGERKLASPTGLLATAWPAIEDEVLGRFAAWDTNFQTADQAIALPALAAAADVADMGGIVIPFPPSVRPTRSTQVRRLPEGYTAPRLRSASQSGRGSGASRPADGLAEDSAFSYSRTEGGLASRALGIAIHTLLEHVSMLRVTLSAEEAAAAVANLLPGVVAQARHTGLTHIEALQLSDKALDIAQRRSLEPLGRWILAPHAEALSEARWTGTTGRAASAAKAIRNLRADRVFRTIEMPPSEGNFRAPDEPNSDPVWWVIDYKTSHAENADLSQTAARSAFLETHRKQHHEQLEAYARFLRALNDAAGEPSSRIQAGLFYSVLGLFDSWEI